MKKIEEFEILKDFFVTKGWIECDNFFTAGNLVIYFRNSHQQWRLKDETMNNGMDITTINFPFNSIEQSRISDFCSQYFKTN